MATLDQLSYFVSVCDSKNMTQAAQRVHVSQPAISKVIKDLEKEYGVRLIQRSKSGQTVTAEGKTLYRYANRLLAASDNLENAMRAVRGEQVSLKVGTSVMFMKMFPHFFKEYKETHANISATNYVFGSLELVRYIEDGTLDVAIFGNTKGVKAHSLTLERVDVELWANKKNPLAQKNNVDLATDLEGFPVVLFNESAPGMDEAKVLNNSPFATFLGENNIKMATNQVGMVKEALINNTAVALLPKGIFADRKELAAIPITPRYSFTFTAYWKDDDAPHIINDFVDFARHYIHESENC